MVHPVTRPILESQQTPTRSSRSPSFALGDSRPRHKSLKRNSQRADNSSSNNILVQNAILQQQDGQRRPYFPTSPTLEFLERNRLVHNAPILQQQDELTMSFFLPTLPTPQFLERNQFAKHPFCNTVLQKKAWENHLEKVVHPNEGSRSLNSENREILKKYITYYENNNIPLPQLSEKLKDIGINNEFYILIRAEINIDRNKIVLQPALDKLKNIRIEKSPGGLVSKKTKKELKLFLNEYSSNPSHPEYLTTTQVAVSTHLSRNMILNLKKNFETPGSGERKAMILTKPKRRKLNRSSQLAQP